MTRSQDKANRLLQIEALLLSHPQGLTQTQLARKLGVNRSTILRNLADMTAPVIEADGRLFIDRESYLVNLRLNLHEALSIHLASRLMITRIDRANPHAAAALRKLGISLEKLAPQLSLFMCSSARSFDRDNKWDDPHYLQTLEHITLAWSRAQKIRVWYRNMDEGQIKEYIFCPYFIEISAIGSAIYAIGQIEPQNEKRTFKLDRIERLELLPESYCLPAAFDPKDLFSQAWGIWFTDQPPVEVVLRFSARVARRVKETRWHQNQIIEDQPDGCLLWRANIAEPKEMLPWVRGWGCQVEVLSPQSLRDAMIEEVKGLREVYE